MSDVLRSLIRVVPFLVIIIVIGVRVKWGKISKEELGLRKPVSLPIFFIWCISFLAFCLLTELVLSKWDLLEIDPHVFTFRKSLLKIVGMVLLAPVAEELLYRGLFLNKLLHLKINRHLCVFIVAVVFTGMHSFAFENTLTSKISMAQVFLDASFFAYARLTTKSIYTPIAMHITGNVIATLEMFLL